MNDYQNLTTDVEEYEEKFGTDTKQLDKICKRDWDVLVVLTGCRVDALSLLVANDVEPVKTEEGNDTIDWMKNVWANSQCDWSDVTYVSGENVWYSEKSNLDLTEHVGNVVDTDSAWCKYLSTTKPEGVTNLATDEEPPLVVHYRQPYPPFIGDLMFGTVKSGNPIFESEMKNWTTNALPYEDHVSEELYQQAYLDNLNEVLKYVEYLMSKDYDVALTSDKGTLLTSPYTHGESNDPRNNIVPWVSP